MNLFDNRAKKIDKNSFPELFGFNVNEDPYTLENLKEDYSRFPKFYFSGWQGSTETVFKDYEAGKVGLASTNYMTTLVNRSSRQARQLSETMGQRFGFPVRGVISSFIAKPPLDRSYHFDHYDGVLFNFSGTKVLTVHPPLEYYPGEIYRYSTKPEDMEKPPTPGERFTLSPGDALYIPAFAHHNVENVGKEETASVSIVFDTTALLIDLFRNTLELCTGQLRPPYQARSMGGPRIYWDLARWKAWTNELETGGNHEPLMLEKIRAELTLEFLEHKTAFYEDTSVRKSMVQEWEMFILDFGRVRYQKLVNH